MVDAVVSPHAAPTAGGLSVAVPFDHLPVGEGLHPDGTAGAIFYVSRTVLDALQDDGPEWKLEDARFLLEAIQEPDAIFEGLERAGHGDCLCYSVRVSRDPDEDRVELPRYGFVLAAFVRPSGWGYVIFDWEWREEHPDCPGHPLNWENDFTRQTWPTT